LEVRRPRGKISMNKHAMFEFVEALLFFLAVVLLPSHGQPWW
jgi:hypothetical protein